VCGEKNVGRFEIAVNDPLPVRSGERVRQRQRDLNEGLNVERATLKPRMERLSIQQAP
jgi:hypothetical protein